MRYKRTGYTSGFTLIEIAVVLFIIALLLGSLFVPLTTQVERRQVSDTEKVLAEVKETLVGFALTNGYLPCPDRTSGGAGTTYDTANDGVEDFNTGTGICFSTTQPGNLPWVTLGLDSAGKDVWGNRFRYRVDGDFAQRTPAAKFTLSSSADLSVCATTTCTTRLTSSTAGEGAAVVLLSLGRNGLGAINALTGTTNPAPSGGTDENQNTGGSTYVYRSHTAAQTTSGATCSDTVAGQPLCEFDDVVIWISKYTLFSRMVAAGKLP